MTRNVMRRVLLSSALALAAGACASGKPARPLPATAAAPAPSPAPRSADPAAAHVIGHTTRPIACVPDPANIDLHRRQYCDKRKRRFYFFDPEHKQYFWENGQPKG